MFQYNWTIELISKPGIQILSAYTLYSTDGKKLAESSMIL